MVLNELFNSFDIFIAVVMAVYFSRLSPRAMLDSAMAAKARQVLSRNVAASQPKSQQNPVPLPESAASLDWSNLVNVATKAIESKSLTITIIIMVRLFFIQVQIKKKIMLYHYDY